MRVEFRQGVPEGCTEWLNTHVGRGNITGLVDNDDYDWFYERGGFSPDYKARHPDDNWSVPTITVKDPKLATWFVLRWS